MKAPVLILLLCLTSIAYAQEYSITVGTNLYLPMSSNKRIYPVLWVSSKYSPSLLLGGFSIGASRTSAPRGNVSFRYNANLTRMAYWEELIEFRDESNQSLGKFKASSADYILALGALAQIELSEHFSIGGGLGVHAMVTSSLHAREDTGFTMETLGKNKFYKPFMPVVPVEISWDLGRTSLNFRYEQSLLKRYKSSIAEYKKDRYGLMIVELAVKL